MGMRSDTITTINQLLIEQRGVPTVITISGPTGAGKSYLAQDIRDNFTHSVVIHTDDYYRSDETMPPEVYVGNEINYDHPRAIQLGRLAGDLTSLTAGLPVIKPTYHMKKSQPGAAEIVAPRKLIIVEGLVANHPTIRALSNYAILVTAPKDIRLARRIERDLKQYGRPAKQTKAIFNVFTEPSYLAYHVANDAAANLVVDSSEE
jgi:uridine kinase